MTTITERLNSAINTIHLCEKKYKYKPNGVQLIAVSKTKPISDITEAIAAGQRHFGENYVQEGVSKVIHFADNTLAHKSLVWHFIGPIQSNKSKLVSEHFDWVHTIDRAKIAQRLSAQRPQEMAPLNVCIQINISGEASKSGVEPNQALELAQLVNSLDNLVLRGLMTIGERSDDLSRSQQQFAQMEQLFNSLQSKFPTIDTLSMGMSGDIETAIKYGSTMVRVGSAIFGPRTTK